MFLCCCDCLIFTDNFSGDALSEHWSVISGGMTLDTGANTAEIISGSVVGPTVNQPNGSGGFSINLYLQRVALTIRFAYVDASNHWRMQTEAGTLWIANSGGSPVVINTVLCKFWEVVGGSAEYIGSRHVAHSTGTTPCVFCWQEGGRMSVSIGAPLIATTGVELHWPNHVVGGNSFRIEPGYNLVVGPTVNWTYHIIEHTELSNCLCSSYACLRCVDQWGDAMLWQVVDGPFAGENVTVNRLRDIPVVAFPALNGYSGNSQINRLSYWQFVRRIGEDAFGSVGGDGTEWSIDLNFCFSTMEADTTAQMYLVDHDGTQIGGGYTFNFEFTAANCAGPWEFACPGVNCAGITLRVTPNAP